MKPVKVVLVAVMVMERIPTFYDNNKITNMIKHLQKYQQDQCG